MSNFQQNQPQGFNRVDQNIQQQQFIQQPQISQQFGSTAVVLERQPIIEERPLVVGQQPIIEREQVVVGQQPIIEQREVVVGHQPIIEQKPVVVGHQPILEQREVVVGQQPIMGEREKVVGHQPIIEERPAIVGEKILIEQRVEKPIFDTNLQTTTRTTERVIEQNLTSTSTTTGQYNGIGLFRQGARIALLSAKNKYLTFNKDKIKHSKERKEREVWCVEQCGENLFALRNEYDGRYLSCDDNKLRLSDTRGEQEIWRIEQAEHDGALRYLLSSYKGDFLSEGLMNLKLRDEPRSSRTFWDVEPIY